MHDRYKNKEEKLKTKTKYSDNVRYINACTVCLVEAADAPASWKRSERNFNQKIDKFIFTKVTFSTQTSAMHDI